MSGRVELRDEAPDGPASRALFAEYLALVGARLGDDFAPSERIFATPDAFNASGAAWVVLYEDGTPAACGGLRSRAPGVGEIKRMFVTGAARRRGHGRRVLRELERRSRARGDRTVLLLTTDVLREAIALYESEGYTECERVPHRNQPVEIWLRKRLHS